LTFEIQKLWLFKSYLINERWHTVLFSIMKKIIHMSDLHVGFGDLGGKFRHIVDNLIAEKGGRAGGYVIVVTGDLIDNAHHPQMAADVRSGFDDLRRAGFEDILVIPGNHDYGTGSNGDKKFVASFQQAFFGEVTGYPRKNIIEDCAFIGLDSMAEELHWYDALWSEGQLGAGQLGRLSAMLREDEVRSCAKRVIYLHHHPFDARSLHQLKDSKKLRKVLMAAAKEGISVDALLYGHNHEGKAHNGQWGIPRCYDAGSATLKPRPKAVKSMAWLQVHSSTRDIDIENEDAGRDQVLPLLNARSPSI
jgi:3',5'-cyclic AMP phosphodiesterase CpdA